ncbi:uncharacterized protein J4E88_001822 [Alternaria novae-zelandiae]|uniref:uncharacterized protein n=1 Tax=Alternaria novae-zelandiae TaxID=430562 RepID=UPI0020C4B7A0|nr:uncharacterized protein J4E88_001822 [Alternaria novae-zelandiae]KAI4693450.1 hypothetical protein J4E88_001822 [Alternaria novae-zelandiae]
MKFTLFILATLLSVTFLGTSAKYVKFINHCPYNVYFWAVGPPASHIDGGDSFRSMVPGNGGSVIHPMVDTERFGGGLSLKIRDLDYYTPGPAGILQVEYNLEESKGKMWYDLSAVDCDLHAGPANPRYCPLIRGGVKLYINPVPNKKDCPYAYCNEEKCVNTYLSPGGFANEPSLMCWAGADIFVETCTDGPGVQTFFGKKPQTGDTVHQAIPAPVVQPPVVQPPVIAPNGMIISPNGQCGDTTGFTCNGSPKGPCCSPYGYCGDTAAHCNPGCLPSFGYCHDIWNLPPIGRRAAAPEPFTWPEPSIVTSQPSTVAPEPSIVTKVANVFTSTTTATETEVDCDTIKHTVTKVVKATRKPGSQFTPPPLRRRSAAM